MDPPRLTVDRGCWCLLELRLYLLWDDNGSYLSSNILEESRRYLGVYVGWAVVEVAVWKAAGGCGSGLCPIFPLSGYWYDAFATRETVH